MKSFAAQATAKVLAFVANKVNPIMINPLTRIWLVINAS
jgi:hypothetical protein